MKASIPEPKELTEISTQTDHPSQDESEKSLFSDSDHEDQSEQIPKTVMSAQPRLSGASNEIQPTERPVTADQKLLPILNKTIEHQEVFENVETEIIQPSSTVTVKQAEMKSASIQTDPLPTLEVSDSPPILSPKSKITPKRKNRKEKSTSEIKTKIQKTPKTPKITKRENDDSGVVHVIPSHAQVFSREDLKNPEKSLKNPKIENDSNSAVYPIHSGPGSGSTKEPLNTTKALVRCYNKLLWFGAEVEELTETKIIENISTFNENDLNDLNLDQMNQSVDILLEKLAYTIKQNNSHSGTGISDQGVSHSLGQQYEHLVGDYKRAINDLNKTNSKKIPFRQKKKQKSFSLRSKSSVELSGDYGIIEDSSTGIGTEIGHLVQPNNSPNEPKRTKRREIKINMSFDSHKSQSFEESFVESFPAEEIQSESIDLGDDLGMPRIATSSSISKVKGVQSDSLMTLTSESFSINGSFGDNPFIEKMNSFHEKLTENLIKQKDLKTKGILLTPNSFITVVITVNCSLSYMYYIVNGNRRRR